MTETRAFRRLSRQRGVANQPPQDTGLAGSPILSDNVRHKDMKTMKRLLMFLGVSALLTSCAHIPQATTVPLIREPESVDVVAVLAGYHSTMHLSTGQRIYTFTMDTNDACCSDTFLFSVLTPTNLTGRYFLVRDIHGPLVRHPALLFKPVTRYHLKVRVSEPNSPLIGSCHIEHGVREAPISKEEADSRLMQLNEDEAFTKQQITRGKVLLKRKDLSANQRARCEESTSNREKHLRYIETTKKTIADLLKNARDDYPDVYDLKWKALEDEGWKSIPRAEGVIQQF
ncbi:MAG: hypothetical protein KJ579_04590, partial [Verrucomicrobia bacterium]|nr:hypothetical protein [Verrucomicrobiota bacterium]